MSIIAVDFDGTLYQHNSVVSMLKGGRKIFTFRQQCNIVLSFSKGSVKKMIGNKEDLRIVLLRSFFRQMKGKTADEMHAFFKSVIDSSRESVNYNLVSRRTKHLQIGDRVVIISGALQPLLEVFVQQLNIRADAIGTELLYDKEGIFTGEIGKNNHGEDKVIKLKLWIKENNADNETIWAYADSESDIPLLEFSHKAIVVQPSVNMRKLAQSKGWEIFNNEGNVNKSA